MRKYLILIMAVVAAIVLLSCGKKPQSEPTGTTGATSATEAAEVNTDSVVETAAADGEKAAAATSKNAISEDGYYYDVENVVLYLHTYGKLPKNYITKKEAKVLGWEGGSVEQVAPGMAIGGDHFGNYDGKLPDAAGRKYKECDIDTHGYKNRGSRRLIYSDDGLFFYTRDHYENFDELYVSKEGKVEWK